MYPFYSVLLHCDWMKSEILRTIHKFMDPLESDIRITTYESKHFSSVGGARYIIRPINAVTQLVSPFQCLLVDVLNETNVNALYLDPIRLNVDVEAEKRAMKYPREGYIHREITNWKLEQDKHLAPILETKGTSIFMVLLRAHSFNVSMENALLSKG